MFRKQKQIESDADLSISLMRRRNRLATQPLFKLLFLGVFICAFAAIAALLFWITTLLGFAPGRDDGLLFIGGAAIAAIGVAVILTERIEAALRRWFFL